MAKKFVSLITEKGKTLIAAAIAGGDTLKLKYIAVGDGNGATVTPTSDQTALVNEVARVEINSLKDTDATKQIVTAEAIIPAATGGFWIREAGVFTEDGTMIAVSQMPEAYKPDSDDGATSTQTLRMLLAVSDTSVVNLTVDDSTVIATEDYVTSQLDAHEKSRNHPDGTLKDKGFVQLSSATDSTSETLAATPKAVKAANDNADSRLQQSENLSDVADAAKALTNLGGVPITRKINTHALSADITLTASDVNAFPAEGGTVGGKGVTSPGLHVNSNTLGAAGQGSHLLWNESGGRGEVDLVCNAGSGIGGFIFRTVNNGNTQEFGRVDITGTGSLDTSNTLNEMGQRVYSPNNPPPIASTAVTTIGLGARVLISNLHSTPDWSAQIPIGAVLIAPLTYGDDRITHAYYSYLMYYVNGNWINAGQVG